MNFNRYKSISFILIFAIAVMFAGSVAGLENSTVSQAKSVSVSARGAIVMEVQSGTILYSKNMDTKRYPASITKIMTTLVALENSSLHETVVYDKDAYANWDSAASNIGIKDGEKMLMEESLYAIMLASANEVCNGVAKHIAGSISAFVDMMNEKAKELGCKNTHFMNPNGLFNSKHYTTPHDMAIISRAAMQNDAFRKIAGTKQYSMKKTNKRKAGYFLSNHHKMLNSGGFPQYAYEYCEGGKTGYTSQSRNTLVTFAKKKNVELICVVMKVDGSAYITPNTYTDTIKLMNYCFENYEKTILSNTVKDEKTDILFTKYNPFFNAETSPITTDEKTGVILPKGSDVNQVTKEVQYYQTPVITNGQRVIGHISYKYDGKEVGGSDIRYTDANMDSLKDSIDMSQWFNEAVEESKKEALPWKKVAVTVILVVTILGLTILSIVKLTSYRKKNRTMYNHKRVNKRVKNRDSDYFTRR